jgi:hypothetical protein
METSLSRGPLQCDTEVTTVAWSPYGWASVEGQPSEWHSHNAVTRDSRQVDLEVPLARLTDCPGFG